jgi:hypothetical protein
MLDVNNAETLFAPYGLKLLQFVTFLKKAGAKSMRDVPGQLAHVRSWSKLSIDYVNYRKIT